VTLAVTRKRIKLAGSKLIQTSKGVGYSDFLLMEEITMELRGTQVDDYQRAFQHVYLKFKTFNVNYIVGI
jgi:hypothetical protein